MTKRNKKQIIIEILPRALWVTFAIIMYLAHHITGNKPVLNDNRLLLIIGIVLTIVGFSIGMYTVYYMGRAFFSKNLLTAGPFKYSRHPMYVGVYIMLSGIGVLFFSWLWFAIMLIFVPIFYLDCKIEEKQMTELHEEYLNYKKKVRMFL